MRFAFRHLKIVAEPGGAVALAALLAGQPAAADAARGGRGDRVWEGMSDPRLFAKVVGGG